MTLSNLEKSLRYYFNDISLLELALTHRSYSSNHNERLEFLGDSILNASITIILFNKFIDIDEGVLSRLRASLVQQNSLIKIANKLNISNYIKLGDGEIKSGGSRRPSILADSIEAIFGAIFQDSGFDICKNIIEHQYLDFIENLDLSNMGKDAKSLLQELLQSKHISLPSYIIVNTDGLAHNQIFEIDCIISDLNIRTKSFGDTRRSAEQLAAKMALDMVMKSNLFCSKNKKNY
ncbi:ribonuclease III [Candidatus Kinetoplastidibacterium crithidiae]|uniref:Ribonuclease 3 n=1 Tax=Candidatus Kinetoplastidibacterium crithidiae TCC036E TaxID=1208918 RepID=M1LX24_9PROT|nr:ribonuclease III [Candidatus Kinetoplastibacterium crithidii]AFZ82599.1 ribonuclease III [Candidatus Kinetoplastibacterium crithidii (ex Angomonas deanei ATCC 30255)]AGF47739.1 ribonuclease III [Candidatus Kinetoplastibacterium crithidii TCC036E]